MRTRLEPANGRAILAVLLALTAGSLPVADASDPAGAEARPVAPPLECGSVNAFRRIETTCGRFDDAFDSIDGHSWLRARDAAADRTGAEGDFQHRTFEEHARGAIRFLAETTGFPCAACAAHDEVRWERLPDDVEVWKRAAATYRARSYAAQLDEQRACARKFVDRRIVELELLAEELRQARPGTESGTDPLPGSLRLAFSDRASVEVRLGAVARRSAWDAAGIEQALAFAARLRSFLDRGTPETWRALVGLAEPAAYAAAVGSDASKLEERTRALRAALDAYAHEIEDLVRAVDFDSGNGPDRINADPLREPLQRLSGQAGPFAGTRTCRAITVKAEGQERATVTLCVPEAILVMETFGALSTPEGLARWRLRVAQFAKALDDTGAMARSGVWVSVPE